MKRSFKYLFGRLLGETARPTTSTAGRNGAAPARKAVWRISADAPNGAWIDTSAGPGAGPGASARKKLAVDSADDWTTSSMDLMSGTDVVEHTMHKAPDALHHGAAGGKAKARKKSP